MVNLHIPVIHQNIKHIIARYLDSQFLRQSNFYRSAAHKWRNKSINHWAWQPFNDKADSQALTASVTQGRAQITFIGEFAAAA